ncbi:HV323 protein, partial [Atractosteus spatula]|nr:HV323 protein [Atractosteus spatula]
KFTQPASAEVKKPGESVKLSCQVSGFLFGTYRVGWIRQAPGMGLEWLASYVSETHRTYHASSVQNCFTASNDISSGSFILQMNTLRAEDTSVYYCAGVTVTRLNQEALQKPALCNMPLYSWQEASNQHLYFIA